MSFASHIGSASKFGEPRRAVSASATDGPTGFQKHRRDQAWAALVGNADALLRRWNGVYEFTDDPACVLRVGLQRACAPVLLADGVMIVAGSPIGVLHFWNEHMPPFPPQGPDFRWAKDMERRLRRSLGTLAVHVGRDPAWAEVRALRADAALSGQLRATQMLRIAGRYGFEMKALGATTLGSLHGVGESFLLWAFARAFNPPALKHHRFLRDRAELWITRDTLTARFLHQAPASATQARSAETS